MSHVRIACEAAPGRGRKDEKDLENNLYIFRQEDALPPKFQACLAFGFISNDIFLQCPGLSGPDS